MAKLRQFRNEWPGYQKNYPSQIVGKIKQKGDKYWLKIGAID